MFCRVSHSDSCLWDLLANFRMHFTRYFSCSTLTHIVRKCVFQGFRCVVFADGFFFWPSRSVFWILSVFLFLFLFFPVVSPPVPLCTFSPVFLYLRFSVFSVASSLYSFIVLFHSQGSWFSFSLLAVVLPSVSFCFLLKSSGDVGNLKAQSVRFQFFPVLSVWPHPARFKNVGFP